MLSLPGLQARFKAQTGAGMKEYIMALDQGTTSSRCILFDRQGRVCSMAQKEFGQIYPKPGWVEHDPMEIWSSQLAVAAEAMSRIKAEPENIAGIGITNQRETTIVWDRETGKPVYNAIVWQCRRTSERVQDLVKQGYGEKIRKRTGLVPDAYFSAAKIEWILENVEGARKRAEEGKLCFGTVDTWLVWNLTGGRVHATDHTNASRTMLYNIHELKWDEELLKVLGIPESILPEVKPSSYCYGVTRPAVLGGEVPIAGIAGDQQAALFGQCCFEKGQVKNTYGTGCFLLMHTGRNAVESKAGLITTIAAGSGGQVEYALEGSIFAAGAAVQWLRDGLGLVKKASETEEWARQTRDTAGMYFVPAFTGLGAPYWNSDAQGMMVGLTRGCEKKHMIRAVLESIAYQTYDVAKVMEEEAGVPVCGFKVDGGASSNDFLMEFQADILDTAVYRPECIETTALGAAYLAGLSVGYYENLEDIKRNWRLGKEFKPHMKEEERNPLIEGWKRAVRGTLAWALDRQE